MRHIGWVILCCILLPGCAARAPLRRCCPSVPTAAAQHLVLTTTQLRPPSDGCMAQVLVETALWTGALPSAPRGRLVPAVNTVRWGMRVFHLPSIVTQVDDEATVEITGPPATHTLRFTVGVRGTSTLLDFGYEQRGPDGLSRTVQSTVTIPPRTSAVFVLRPPAAP